MFYCLIVFVLCYYSGFTYCLLSLTGRYFNSACSSLYWAKILPMRYKIITLLSHEKEDKRKIFLLTLSLILTDLD